MNGYSQNHSEVLLWKKIKAVALKVGTGIIYNCLLLYYALQKKDIPVWAKTAITGALGYFIFPIDAIPDLIPGIGYTDDLGVILFALGLVSTYIDDDVRKKAREKLSVWFGNIDFN
jgi:uncharacterized membrane protein YkvA (DUF1232 family)